MSKERELLQKIVNHMWQGELVDEIKEVLAQPEQEQEPVAWMQDSIELYVLEEKSAIRGYVIPLYTAPPKREPLSEDTMLRLISEHRDFPPNLVRAIEKAHGIGGGE